MNVPSLNGRFITEEGKMELDGIRSLGVSPVTQFEYGIDEDSGCITRRRPDGPWCWEGPSLAWFEHYAGSLGFSSTCRETQANGSAPFDMKGA